MTHQMLSRIDFLNDRCPYIAVPAVDAIASGKSVFAEPNVISMQVASWLTSWPILCPYFIDRLCYACCYFFWRSM